jgi:hypothetical protein
LVLVALLGFSESANAGLVEIGTATYGGTDYKLIFEGDLGSPGLVWFDYARFDDSWGQHVAWASNLGFTAAEVHLDPAYTTTIDWSTGWRLPNVGANPQGAFNQTTSEWGRLYYVSFGYEAHTLPPPGAYAPFDDAMHDRVFWFNTLENPLQPFTAWAFSFEVGVDAGYQYAENLNNDLWGMSVRFGTVSLVPEPSVILLCGFGLAALAARRKRRTGP